MIEIRYHGRGGQGAVTAAEILAKAAFEDGKYSQAFPSFGVERRGAPVSAFTRIDDKPIELRYQIYNPDHILVLDDGLADVVDIYSGIKENSDVIINTHKDIKSEKVRIHKIDATKVALDILGYFAKKTGVVSIESLEKVIKDVFPSKIGEKNVQAVRKAYDMG